jgi:hypothetical protein
MIYWHVSLTKLGKILAKVGRPRNQPKHLLLDFDKRIFNQHTIVDHT